MLDFVQLLGSSLLIRLQLGGPHANVASTVVFLIFDSLLVDHAREQGGLSSICHAAFDVLSTHLCEWLDRVSQCGVHVGGGWTRKLFRAVCASRGCGISVTRCLSNNPTEGKWLKN